MIKKLLLLSFSMLFVIAAFSQTDRYWVTGGDGNWNSTSNWSDASGGASGFTVPNANTFRVIFDANSGSPTVNLGSNITVGQLQVIGNQSLVLSAGAVFTLSVGNNYAGVDFLVGTGSALTVGTNSNLTLLGNNTATIDGELIINIGRTFTTNAAGAVSTVNGTISNSGTVTGTAAGLIFAAGGNYNHNQNGGVIPTATWNVASNVNILGIIDAAPTGIAQTFGNFIWNAAGQTAAVNINAAPTAINGTFRIQNTNGQIVRLTGGAGAGVTWNVVNFLQNDGTLELSSNAIMVFSLFRELSSRLVVQ